MRIFAFHLLNDLSGSPKVLSQVIRGFVRKGEEVHLVSSMKKEGFLSSMDGVNYIDNKYTFHQNLIFRLFALFYTQLFVIFKLYRQVKASDVIYINTVLPFGGAILGKLRGCKVIYHLHETSIKPRILKKFLFVFVKKMGTEVIYVSNYLKNAEPLSVPSHIVYNSLEDKFLKEAKEAQKTPNKRPIVLMICSLKAYKGIFEYIDLAKSLGKFDFQLIVNAEEHEIDSFFSEHKLPANLTVFTKQKNVAPFYEKADVLMNLSRPDQWVETFGLTVIEAMAYGIPSIVPPLGGIAELVEDGVNGYKISCYDSIELIKSLHLLLNQPNIYNDMHQFCLQKVDQFSEEKQINQIHRLLTA